MFSEELRPLKLPKLGYPDFYPRERPERGTTVPRGPQRDGNPVQGGEEIQLKIGNEKLCISVGTGFGTCRVDVELRRRRVT